MRTIHVSWPTTFISASSLHASPLFVSRTIPCEKDGDLGRAHVGECPKHVDLETLVRPLFSPRASTALIGLHRNAERPEAIPDGAKLGRDGTDADCAADLPSTPSQRQQAVKLDADILLRKAGLTLLRGELRSNEDVRVVPVDVYPIGHSAPQSPSSGWSRLPGASLRALTPAVSGARSASAPLRSWAATSMPCLALDRDQSMI